MTDRNLLLSCVFVVALWSVACSGSPERTGAGGSSGDTVPRSQSVVVLLMDGVRVDHIGAYGAAESATPNLDAFADRAVRFDRAFSQAPDAAASLASLLTSLYPTTHGLVESGDRLADEAFTLPEALAGAGLESAAFLTSTDYEGRGLEQGFDVFETGSGALDRALQWISQNAGADFFLMVDLGAVDPAAIDMDNPEKSYVEQVRALDQAANRVLGGLGDQVTIAVVSLSGFDLGEHGEAGTASIYAPETHVPMLLRSPALGPGRSIDKIVEVADLGPTLIALVGEEPTAELQGRSLIAILQGAGTPPYVAFGEAAGGEEGYFAALGGYRLVVRGDDEASELYELTRDPAEQIDLAASDPDRVEVLEDHLSAWKKMVSAASLDPERRTEELDEEALEQLRSLGYIQ